MAKLSVVKSPNPLLVAVGTVVLVGLIGSLMIVPSLVCIPGLLGDGACPTRGPAPMPAPKAAAVLHPQDPTVMNTPAATPVDAANAPVAVAAAPVTAPAASAEPPKGNVVAGSFALLKPQPDAASATGLAAPAAGPETGAGTPLTPKTRVVVTTAVRPDGSLVGGPAIDASTPGPAVVQAASHTTVGQEAVQAVAAVAAPTTPASDTTTPAGNDDVSAYTASAPAPDNVVKPMPARPTEKVASVPESSPPAASAPVGSTMVVGGSGVTVRSGPHTKSGMLFNLAAGQTVKVSDKQHGWAHITDSQGRSGWAYASLLRAGH
jgi:hypothetical protein